MLHSPSRGKSGGRTARCRASQPGPKLEAGQLEPAIEAEHSPNPFTPHQGERKAVGKLSTADPGLAKLAFRKLASFLDNPDPVVRGYASWALGNIGFDDVICQLKAIETDENKLTLWRDGDLKELTAAQLAKEAIEKISHA